MPVEEPLGLEHVRERTLREVARMPQAVGRYSIRGELGRGGMGIVYDAYDPQLDRRVALKLLDASRLAPEGLLPDHGERFLREMRATSAIFHPALVAILDAGLAGGQLFYVMERVEGESLEERVTRQGPVSRAEGIAVAIAIARGLAAAHDAGLVHRDLKPSNVLLPTHGAPKVADFGLCHVLSAAPHPDEAALILGSPHYLAPEQVRGEPVTPRTDLFALGAVLLRALTGLEPFPARSFEAHLERILHGDPDGLDLLDPDLADLTRDLMQKDASLRPASAAVVLERLEHMAGARPRRWLRPFGYVVASVALVVAVAGSLLLRAQLVSLDREAERRLRQVDTAIARRDALLPLLTRAVENEEAAGGTRHGSNLRFTEPHRALRHEIAGSENRIAIEKGRYNEAAAALNSQLESLPWRLLRGSLAPRPYLDHAHAPGPLAPSTAGENRARVLDAPDVLSPPAEALLERELDLLQRDSGLDVGVRIAPGPLPPEPFEAYASRVFEADGLGADDPLQRGVLVIYDPEVGDLRFQIGYGLEPLLPDAWVGEILETHARPLLAAGRPLPAFRLALRMLKHRIRVARRLTAPEHELSASARPRFGSGGGGATARAPLHGESAPARAEARREDAIDGFSAAETPEVAYERYLAWLSDAATSTDVGFLTPESRSFLARFPLTPGYAAFVYRKEAHHGYRIRTRDDRALLFSEDDPLVAPHFLSRSEAGWQIDLVAEASEVLNVDGGPYTWTLLDGPYTNAFLGDLVVIDGLVRVRGGSNRALPPPRHARVSLPTWASDDL